MLQRSNTAALVTGPAGYKLVHLTKQQLCKFECDGSLPDAFGSREEVGMGSTARAEALRKLAPNLLLPDHMGTGYLPGGRSHYVFNPKTIS